MKNLRRRWLCAALFCLLWLPSQTSHAGDRDSDGISNKLDRCPDEPEDIDGYQDTDGCRDPSTAVNIRLQNADGATIESVVSSLKGEGGEGRGDGDWTVEVHHGTYTLTAQAEGYRPLEERVIVPEQASFDVEKVLERLMGKLSVRVVDEQGKPIAGAAISFDKGAATEGTGGSRTETLAPGDHIVSVRAPGFANAMEIATVQPDGAHELSLVLAPLVRDADGDGIVDDKDSCAKEAEDFDGFQDIDGCPDPTVQTTFEFLDEIGKPVRTVEARVMGDGGDGKGGDHFTLALHPGRYEVFATADSYEKVDEAITVPGRAPSHKVSFKMERVWATLILYVMDDDGAPIDEFWWNLDHGENSPGDGGGLYAGKMDPGPHVLYISAQDHAPAKASILLEPGLFSETSITLYRTRIKVTPDKIEISDKVYFDTAKATIKVESYRLLDEVVAAMRSREDMLRVRVEGHTDSRGSAAANRKLSDDRAAAVRAYLIQQGIAEDRLTSVGYGEDQPIDDREAPDAWERNRRVEFVIEQWSNIKVDKEIEPREAIVEVKTTTRKPPVWPGFGILDGSPPPLPPGATDD